MVLAHNTPIGLMIQAMIHIVVITTTLIKQTISIRPVSTISMINLIAKRKPLITTLDRMPLRCLSLCGTPTIMQSIVIKMATITSIIKLPITFIPRNTLISTTRELVCMKTKPNIIILFVKRAVK